jgi:CRP-like cAMP-binding protein
LSQASPQRAALLQKILGSNETIAADAASLALGPIRSRTAEKQRMLLHIEKMLLLKSVEFFSSSTDDVLLEVAALSVELPVPAGQRIIEKGRIESSMYIVGDGVVSVHDGDRPISDLQKSDVFGELAMLDPQPRTADVTAKTDAILLRIDHATLVDLMAEDIEVTHGIIRYLIRRYRPAAMSAAQ